MIECAEFETGIVGSPIFRILDAPNVVALNTEINKCQEHIIAKIPGKNLIALNRVIDLGFRVSCVSVHLELDVGNYTPHGKIDGKISTLINEDLPEAYKISDDAFKTGNRYANDPFITSFTCEIHRRWLRNSLNGYADYCIKSSDGQTTTGYATLHLDAPHCSIGLLATAPLKRHSGLGRKKVENLIAFAAKEKISKMKIVTEMNNYLAIKFYEQLGFKFSDFEFSVYRLAK